MAGCGWNWLEMLCTGQKQSGVVRNGHLAGWSMAGRGHKQPKNGQKYQKMAEMDINGWMWLEVDGKSGNAL